MTTRLPWTRDAAGRRLASSVTWAVRPKRPAIGSRISGERGFALLAVLWTMVLLALLVARITATARADAQVAANLRGSAVAEAWADGAVNVALFHLLALGDQR